MKPGRLAQQKGCRIDEGHPQVDHVHMLISIPPKCAVSSVIGYVKGKSAIHVARHFLKRERNYAGPRLWARGSCGYGREKGGSDPALHSGTGG